MLHDCLGLRLLACPVRWQWVGSSEVRSQGSSPHARPPASRQVQGIGRATRVVFCSWLTFLFAKPSHASVAICSATRNRHNGSQHASTSSSNTSAAAAVSVPPRPASARAVRPCPRTSHLFVNCFSRLRSNLAKTREGLECYGCPCADLTVSQGASIHVTAARQRRARGHWHIAEYYRPGTLQQTAKPLELCLLELLLGFAQVQGHGHLLVS